MINANIAKKVIKESLGLEVEISGVERIGTTHEYMLSTNEGKIKFNALNTTVDKVLEEFKLGQETCTVIDPTCQDPNCACKEEKESSEEVKVEETTIPSIETKKRRRKSKDTTEEKN